MLRTRRPSARPFASALRTPLRAPRCCAAETLEARQLLAAVPAGVALDTTFGNAGFADMRIDGAGFSVEPSGKLIVQGHVDVPGTSLAAVLRLNADGSPDPTFHNGQPFTLAPPADGNIYNLHGSVLLPAGGVLVSGERVRRLPDTTLEYRAYLARYNPDGTLDHAFGGAAHQDGIVIPAGGSLGTNIGVPELLPSGKLFAAGNVLDAPGEYDFAFWRFNPDGTPDATFGTDGFRRVDVLPDDFVLDLARLPDDSFFLRSSHGVLAFNADGSLLGPIGTGTWFGEVAPTPDGKVVVADVVSNGTVSNPVYTTTVRRFFADGTLDTAFGDNPDDSTTLEVGANGDYPTSLSVLPDGSVLVRAISADANYGQHDTLVHLSPGGTPDPAFGVNGFLTLPVTFSGAVVPVSADRFYVGGEVLERGENGQNVRRPVILAYQLHPGITPDPGGPYGPVREGAGFEVSGAGSTTSHGSIVKYEWDANYSGFEFTPDAEGGTATLTAVADNPKVALRVTTDQGLQAISPVPAEVRVINAPPTMLGFVANPGVVAFGSGTTVYGTVADPGGDPVTVRIDFGDGTAPVEAPVQQFGFSAVHTFAARGTYTVRATATDDEGASSTSELTVVAADIVGNVYRDVDDNGRPDFPNDPAAPGVTVYLDTDGDDALDDAEPRAVTNASGDYSFSGLANGTYSVRVVPTAGSRVSNVPGALTPVTVTNAGGARRDFGLTTRSRITGIVFNDADADGVRDPGEGSLRGNTLLNLYLDLNNDGWRDANEPKSIGIGDQYVFANLAPGTYTVRYLPGLTPGNATENEAAQTFPNERGGQTGYTVTVGAAEVSGGHDFGSYFGNTSVTGIVYLDRDRNGRRGAAADGEVLLGNRVVYLDHDGDGTLDETRARTPGTAGGGGSYLLPVVRGHTYTVRTALPEGWTQSQPAGGAPYVITVDPQNTVSLQNRDFGTHPIAAPAVVGRHLFYYKSPLSGATPQDPKNDRAIATDKVALLPDEQPSFANVSSYSRGINGLMLDLNDLTYYSPPANLGFLHFALGNGPSQDPAAWTPITPLAGVIRRGAGVDSSDRLVVLFGDNQTRNQWLRVTVDPGPVTGLAAPDVFYFGNLIGESGDTLSPFRVTASDLGAIKKALNTDATVSNRFDFNRDGKVNALDLGLAKAYLNRGLAPLAPPGGATRAANRDDFLAGLLA